MYLFRQEVLSRSALRKPVPLVLGLSLPRVTEGEGGDNQAKGRGCSYETSVNLKENNLLVSIDIETNGEQS